MQDMQMTKEGFTAQIKVNGKWVFLADSYFGRFLKARTATLASIVGVMAKLNSAIGGGDFEYWTEKLTKTEIRYVKVVTTWTVVEEN